MKWTPADEEGIIKFLVADRNFNESRVRQVVKKINADRGKSNQGESLTTQYDVSLIYKEEVTPPNVIVGRGTVPVTSRKEFASDSACHLSINCGDEAPLLSGMQQTAAVMGKDAKMNVAGRLEAFFGPTTMKQSTKRKEPETKGKGASKGKKVKK